MSVIPESGMNFGKYDEKDLFHIETSEIYKKLGDGIPTVEFILKYNENNIDEIIIQHNKFQKGEKV